MNNINNLTVNNKDTLSLLSEAQKYLDQNQLVQANHLYQRVLELEPGNLVSLNGLGRVAMKAGMLSLAVELFKVACEVDPDNITVNKNIALAYTRMSLFNDAILHYMHILNLDNNNGEVHGELARLYLQEGNLEHALSHYRYAFKLNAEEPRNFHGLVQLDAKSISQDNISRVEKILLNPDVPLDARSSFYFALGTAYDSLGRYEEAFANYAVANMSKPSGFNIHAHETFITHIIESFSAEFFKTFKTEELNQSKQPVFIVGMPRSGTTLVEQVLASHSDVYAAGELNQVTKIAQRLNLAQHDDQTHSAITANIDSELLDNYARYYLNDVNDMATSDYHQSAQRITDKMPMNYLYLGIIALLFPKAKIIHCNRHPLDVCLSCYFQNFAGHHSYANDLNSIALYYQQYDRLMSHWNKVLPVSIHTVNYEDMVSDAENTIRLLNEFVGLEWQGSCMEFYKTQRHVNTASLIQVRKKMYQSSKYRWLHYDQYLTEPKQILQIEELNSTGADIFKSQNMKNGKELCNYPH